MPSGERRGAGRASLSPRHAHGVAKAAKLAAVSRSRSRTTLKEEAMAWNRPYRTDDYLGLRGEALRRANDEYYKNRTGPRIVWQEARDIFDGPLFELRERF